MTTRNQTLTAAIACIAFAFACGAAMSQTLSFPDTIKGKTLYWSHTDTTGKDVLFRLYRSGAVAYTLAGKEQFVPVEGLPGAWLVKAFYAMSPQAESDPSNTLTISLYRPDEPPPVTQDGFPWLAGTADLLSNGRWISGNVTTKYSAPYGGGLLFWGTSATPACWEVVRSMTRDAVVEVRIHARMPNDPNSMLHFSVNEEEKHVQINGTAWKWYDFGSYAVDEGTNIMQFRAYQTANFLADSLDIRVGGVTVPSAPVLEIR
jgi:hypothetical protein